MSLLNTLCYRCASSMSELCDCDANLFHPDLTLQECLTNAAAVNVKYFVVPGSTMQDSMQSLSLAREMPNIISTAGVHPYHVRNHSLEIKEELLRLLSTTECACVVRYMLLLYIINFG